MLDHAKEVNRALDKLESQKLQQLNQLQEKLIDRLVEVRLTMTAQSRCLLMTIQS